jgi:hypothetical protein
VLPPIDSNAALVRVVALAFDGKGSAGGWSLFYGFVPGRPSPAATN